MLRETCPKCTSRNQVFAERETDGSTRIGCFTCGHTLRYVERRGETVVPDVAALRAQLSTREWIEANWPELLERALEEPEGTYGPVAD